ncbi:MAG: transcriptional regulator [Acidobacteriota bacterium]
MRISERDLEARRRAQALWDDQKKQGQKMLEEREKVRQADAAKVERLRALRLAKEAEERKAVTQTIVARRKSRA